MKTPPMHYIITYTGVHGDPEPEGFCGMRLDLHRQGSWLVCINGKKLWSDVTCELCWAEVLKFDSMYEKVFG